MLIILWARVASSLVLLLEIMGQLECVSTLLPAWLETALLPFVVWVGSFAWDLLGSSSKSRTVPRRCLWEYNGVLDCRSSGISYWSGTGRPLPGWMNGVVSPPVNLFRFTGGWGRERENPSAGICQFQIPFSAPNLSFHRAFLGPQAASPHLPLTSCFDLDLDSLPGMQT